jgi:hypothetical protein
MKLYAIKREEVNPAWKMRAHQWLDIHTGAAKFSVQVRDPELKKWAHVYDAANTADGENPIVFFGVESEALAMIAGLKGRAGGQPSAAPKFAEAN